MPPKSDRYVKLSKEDQGIFVPRPIEQQVRRDAYNPMSVDDFLDEYEEKYMDEDFMAVVADGKLTNTERLKMQLRKENGKYKRVNLTSQIMSRAENIRGKELQEVKKEFKMKTFHEKQKRRISIATTNEPLAKKILRFLSCGPTPGKLPHPKVQAKFLPKIVRADYALKFNQPVNYCDNLNRSGLYLATFYGYTHIVQLLCAYNADPNICELEKEQNAGHVAAEKGYGDILDYLLDRGLDLTMGDKMGLTPLMHAANAVECDIKIDMVDNRRWTALHYASQKGFYRICKYLAAQGYMNGQTPLDIAEMELDNIIKRLSPEEAKLFNEKNAIMIENYENVINVLNTDMTDWRAVEELKRQKELNNSDF